MTSYTKSETECRPPRAFTPDAETAVLLFRACFFNRTDKVAFKPPWDATACPAVGDDQLDDLLRHHVEGGPFNVRWATADGKSGTDTVEAVQVGTYSPAPDNTTVFAVADFDGGAGHSHSLADPLGAATELIERCERVGLFAYLAKSRSGSGFHVWMFFRAPIEAAKVRRLMFGLIPAAKLAKGDGWADPKNHVGIEVFPKQDRHAHEGGIGNQVWLPWCNTGKNGGGLFHQVNEQGEFAPYLPDDFMGNTAEQVDAVLAKFPAEEKPPVRPPSPPRPMPMNGDRYPASDILAKALREVASLNRNDNGLELACQLRDNRYSRDEAEPYMRDYVAAVRGNGDHAYTEREALASLKSAYTSPPREPWTLPWLERCRTMFTLRAVGSASAEPPKAEIPIPEKPPDPPTSAVSDSLPIVTIGQMVQDHPKMREAVIECYLRRGETANIIAPPKLGKSWFSYGMAIPVATKRPWLGMYPTAGGNVLLIDNELHRETIANRIPKVCEKLYVPFDEVKDRISVMSLRGKLRDLPSLAGELLKIEPGRFSLIVFDAWYRAMPAGMSENDNGAMAGMYNLVDCIADRTGSAFAIVHHTSRGSQSDKSVTDTGSGAGSQSRAVDAHIVMRPHEEDGVVVMEAALRSWAPVPPMCLRWLYPVWQPDPLLDPTKLRTSKTQKRADDTQGEKAAKRLQEQADKEADENGRLLKAVDKAAKSAKPLSKTKIKAISGFNSDKFEIVLARLSDSLVEDDIKAEIGSGAKVKAKTIRRKTRSDHKDHPDLLSFSPDGLGGQVNQTIRTRTDSPHVVGESSPDGPDGAAVRMECEKEISPDGPGRPDGVDADTEVTEVAAGQPL